MFCLIPEPNKRTCREKNRGERCLEDCYIEYGKWWSGNYLLKRRWAIRKKTEEKNKGEKSSKYMSKQKKESVKKYPRRKFNK